MQSKYGDSQSEMSLIQFSRNDLQLKHKFSCVLSINSEKFINIFQRQMTNSKSYSFPIPQTFASSTFYRSSDFPN